MGQIRHIRCPHCGEWTIWAGKIEDRCFSCDGFLEPRRFSREVEKKILAEVIKENDYLFIDPRDSALKRRFKQFLNSLRWLAFYLQIAFFGFITLLLVLLSFVAA